MQPTTDFNKLNEMSSEIAYWGVGDPVPLLLEKYECIRVIKDFLLLQTKHITNPDPKLEHQKKSEIISNNFQAQVETGRRYFSSIKYSDMLRQSFRRLSHYVAQDIYEAFGHIDFAKCTLEDRKIIAEDVLKIFIKNARSIFHPDIKIPDIELSDLTSIGAILISMDMIKEGQLGPIHINPSYLQETTLSDLVNTISHEATHHVMVQLASMAQRGEMNVPSIHEKDIWTIILTAELDATAPPCIWEMYRENPFERIAFQTGDSVESLFKMHCKSMSSYLDHCWIQSVDITTERAERDPQSSSMWKNLVHAFPSLNA